MERKSIEMRRSRDEYREMKMKIGKTCVELGHGQIDLGQFYFICKILSTSACTPS